MRLLLLFFSLCEIQICQTPECSKELLLTVGLRLTAVSLCCREFFHMSLLSAYLLLILPNPETPHILWFPSEPQETFKAAYWICDQIRSLVSWWSSVFAEAGN